MDVCRKWNYIKDMERLNSACKGCRSKPFPPDRLFRPIEARFSLLRHSLSGERDRVRELPMAVKEKEMFPIIKSAILCLRIFF